MRKPFPLLSPYWFILSFSMITIQAGFSQTGGTITGRVIDKKTGSPLPLVNIIVKGTSTGTTTSTEGGYLIKNLAPGTYSIIATLIGHETVEISGVVVTGGGTTLRNISLVDSYVQAGDMIVYGASLQGERITDAPSAVTVLSPAEIKLASGSGQVPKLLEMQPGVDIAQSGVHDFNVNTRGFNSSLNRRLLVLLDGRDLAVAFLGSQEWNGLSIPVEDLGKIELIRGPGSALYGANAFNGVINILTPSPRSISGGKLTIAGGEKNTLRSDLRFASASGPWSYKANVGRVQADTWSISRLSFPFEYVGFNPFLNSEVVELNRAKVASTYGSARIDYEFASKEVAILEGGVTQVENEVLVTGIGRVQIPKAVKPWGRVSYTSEQFHVQGSITGRRSIVPQVSLSTGLPLDEASFIGQLDAQYRFRTLGDDLFVVLGASHKYQSVDSKGTLTLSPHYDNLSGVYGQLEYRIVDQVKGIAAGRLDRSTLHQSQFSPKIALVWSPSTSHSVRATYNKAFQSPNYSELFLNVKHPIRNLVYFGNEELVVEKITGYEVGYKGIFGNLLFFTVDGFYNQLRDFITDLAPSVNPRYPGQIRLPGETITRTVWSYGNAGRVNEFGFEVAANFYVNENITVSGNYAFFDFEVKEQNINDALLPNAPKNKLNAGLTFREESFEISLFGKYVPTFDWAAGIYKGRVLAYALFNLDAVYRVSSQLEFGLNVTNVFDRKHYQIFGGSLLGRRAIISTTASF